MAIEEDDGGGIPEWVVTFGDMMSLLLTFFIMLVSLSEMKQEEKYQALVDSIRRQFGHDSTMSSLAPGKARPRNSFLDKLSSMGRAKRHDTHRGGNPVKAPKGDHPRVRIVRPGGRTAVGTVIPFEEESAELSSREKVSLRIQAHEFRGKPQKIEVRAHTGRRPPRPPYENHWQLAFARGHAVMKYLTELGIQPERMRLSLAGPYEPIHTGTDTKAMRQNPRVEVFMLDEQMSDLEGSPEQRRAKYRVPTASNGDKRPSTGTNNQ